MNAHTRSRALLLTLCVCLVACLLTRAAAAQSVDFGPFIRDLTKFGRWPYRKDSSQLRLPLLYEGRGFRIEISPQPISFAVQQATVETGFDRFYAASFSVIYENRLVSLFDPGGFVCLTLPTLTRDRAYEKTLNTKPFQYHCLLNGQLVEPSPEQADVLRSASVIVPLDQYNRIRLI